MYSIANYVHPTDNHVHSKPKHRWSLYLYNVYWCVYRKASVVVTVYHFTKNTMIHATFLSIQVWSTFPPLQRNFPNTHTHTHSLLTSILIVCVQYSITTYIQLITTCTVNQSTDGRYTCTMCTDVYTMYRKASVVVTVYHFIKNTMIHATFPSIQVWCIRILKKGRIRLILFFRNTTSYTPP